MQLLCPKNFTDYELIDCGNFEKLERWGNYITIRPEPQAVWNAQLSKAEWERKAHLKFEAKSSSQGTWRKLKNAPDQWRINYTANAKNAKQLTFRLGLTSFKHVGLFPEQAVNWDYITNSINDLNVPQPKFLNLFAYTGAASIAACAAGADVTHVDSIKQVVNWANENMLNSGLNNIRWTVEDALKFARREVKRGNTYNGIILDPPAFGHGANGEKWILEDNITELIELVLQLLAPKHFLILNAYSLGFSSIILENLLKKKAGKNLQTGELYLQSTSDLKLPLGVWGRFRNY